MNLYTDKYKADVDIFEQIPTIDIGGNILRGLWYEQIKSEAIMYLHNSNDLLVKKFLPNAFVATEEDATNKLYNFQKGFLTRSSIFFCITPKGKPAPFGYVVCNSPLAMSLDNQAMNEWTIDFWLAEKARGHGIMRGAVYSVISYLQKKNVPSVHAYVDKENTNSIKLLLETGLHLTDETADKKMYKFSVLLKK